MINAAGLIDTVLDRTIVGGYTNIGYRVRRLSWAERQLPRIDGKTVLISGATSGIGYAAAEELARLGARVRLLARSDERGERARAAIAAAGGNDAVDVVACDLGSLASVRRCAARLLEEGGRIDVLINNAGVLPPARELSPDGIELTFATNVLGPFLLTNTLVALMRSARGAPARIINVSSGGMYSRRLDVDDLQSARGEFDGVRAYAHTKRMQVVLTELWAQRLAGDGIVAAAMQPGWVDTPGVQSSLPRFHRVAGPFLRSPAEGADTIVWLANSSEGTTGSGGFWHDRRRRPTHILPGTTETPAEREQLWSECERLSAPAAE
jgi:dehydrogenase/reductase SDR family protein 12